jgi:hypothetical protein
MYNRDPDRVNPDTVSLSATRLIADKKPSPSGAFLRAADGARTHDLLHGKQTL